MVHIEEDNGAAAFYLLFVLSVYITCLTPVVIARAVQGKFTLCARPSRPASADDARAGAGAAGAVCWKIHPTAVEWAQRPATFEPHEILGVAWDVSERALRSAYRRLALVHHPDKGGDPVRFQLIVTAYEALMNRLHGRRSTSPVSYSQSHLNRAVGRATPRKSSRRADATAPRPAGSASAWPPDPARTRTE